MLQCWSIAERSEHTMANNDELIEITGYDNKVTKYELFDMILLNSKYYALLVEAGKGDVDEPEIVPVRYREVGESVYFDLITNQEEFDEVSEHIKSLTKEGSKE